MLSRISKFILLFILILGILVACYFAYFNRYVWMDEVYSIGILKYNLEDIIRIDSYDVHPPLYYIFLKIFDPNRSFVIAHYLSFIPFILLALSLAYFFKYEIKWNKSYSYILLITLLEILVLPNLIGYLIQVRMYGWGNLLVTWGVIFSIKIIKNNVFKNWVGLVIVSVLSIYINYYVFIDISFLCITLLTYLIYNHMKIKFWFFSLLITLILVFPAIIYAFNQFLLQRSHNFHAPSFSIRLLFHDVFMPFIDPIALHFNTYLFWLLIITGTLLLSIWIFTYYIFFINFNKYNKISIYISLVGPFLYIESILLNVIMPLILKKHTIPRYMTLILGAFLLSWLFTFFKINISVHKFNIIILLSYIIAISNIFVFGYINYEQGKSYQEYINAVKKINEKTLYFTQSPVAYTTALAFPKDKIITFNLTHLSANGFVAYKKILNNMNIENINFQHSRPPYLISSKKFMKKIPNYKKLPGSYKLALDSPGVIHIYKYMGKQ